MNRSEEYEALLRQLEQLPNDLETTVERAVKREKASRIKRYLYRPAVSLAACFAALSACFSSYVFFPKTVTLI